MTIIYYFNNLERSFHRFLDILNKVYELSDQFRVLEIRFTNTEEYLQRALTKGNLIWKCFIDEIITEAVEKAWNGLLTNRAYNMDIGKRQ